MGKQHEDFEWEQFIALITKESFFPGPGLEKTRFCGGKKNSLKKAVQNKSDGARGDSKCVKLVTNIEIMKSENESENESKNENESENESENENKSENESENE